MSLRKVATSMANWGAGICCRKMAKSLLKILHILWGLSTPDWVVVLRKCIKSQLFQNISSNLNKLMTRKSLKMTLVSNLKSLIIKRS